MTILPDRGPRTPISVVTVTWENRVGLERTLESVRAQRGVEVESIVIDGGSADGTREYLQSLPPGPEFRFISERDDGIYHAMNKGWRLARYPLISFMNAGDTFSSPDSLAQFSRLHAATKYEWAYGCARLIRSDGSYVGVLSMVPFKINKLALGLQSVPHQAAIFSRDLLDSLGGFSETMGLAADQDLMFRAGLCSAPRLILEFVAEFEDGGRGSTRPPGAFARDMLKARRRANYRVVPGPGLDPIVTGAVILSSSVRHYSWRFLNRRLVGAR